LTLREEHSLRVCKNRVLKILFGTKRDEIIGDWRKLHNEELHYLHSSANIIRTINSRRMRWARNVARMGGENAAFWWESQKETDHYDDLNVGGRKILKLILEK
jgi:hypothetical protein